METEEDNYYDIEKWLCLDKELSYCLNNDYKSNKIKEIIIIENQDTTYKYKY